jgi:hypothetical protein
MELFKDTNFDFLRRKWWFILPSLILTLAGVVSLFLKGGPRYSIDFRGGAVMEVRWENTPPVQRIRAAVSSRVSGVSVVAAHDLAGSNEVLVAVQTPGEGDPTALRQTIAQALSTVGGRYSIRSFEVIGPQIGADLRRQTFIAAGGASGGMLLYLAWRFRIGYGVAAVLGLPLADRQPRSCTEIYIYRLRLGFIVWSEKDIRRLSIGHLNDKKYVNTPILQVCPALHAYRIGSGLVKRADSTQWCFFLPAGEHTDAVTATTRFERTTGARPDDLSRKMQRDRKGGIERVFARLEG